MTKLLKKVFIEVSKLSEREQDELASMILAELASESRWEKAFNNSKDELSRLTDEAIVEYRNGKTQLLDPETL